MEGLSGVSSEATKKPKTMNDQIPPKIYMVFDVESVGLHGEGFAVGYVVCSEGKMLESGMFACHPDNATGDAEGRKWVAKNCPTLGSNFDTAWSVRTYFWNTWQKWKAKGAILVADCGWPVEARFLFDCLGDVVTGRELGGPYPLHDLASVLLARGLDPLAKYERLPDELPEHNPLCDAKQSARILLETMYWV